MVLLRLFFNSLRNISYLPNKRLANKVAVVTASTSGVGLAIAKRLGLEGATVSISSRNEKNVERAIEELKKCGVNAVGAVCNVINANDRKNLLEKVVKDFGGIDFLVSSAAINIPGELLDCSDTDWNETFEVNLKSSFLLVKEALAFMIPKAKGKIVFISAIASYRPLDLVGVYSVSKIGIIGLTKMIAHQLANKGITVNAIAPGFINTKSYELFLQGDFGRRNLALIPLNRYGTPEDIAGGVAFLVSDDANYITGEVIVIAGGICSRL